MTADFDRRLLKKIIAMFSRCEDRFLNFKAGEVIVGPNDRALMGYDNYFPVKWLVEDFGFTKSQAVEFVRRVHEREKKP